MEKSPPDSKEYLGIAPGHQRKIPEVPVSGFVIMLAVIAALGGLLFGYDTGVISGALLFLRPEFQLSASMVGTVTAIVLFGAVIGAAISGLLVEHFGRRIMLTIAAGVFSLGALVTALAPSISALIAGRFVLGIAIGIASYTSPLYISESAPARVRGALVSLSQLFITIGILAAYLVDFAFAYPEGWRWMFGLGVVPAMLLGLGMIILPDSPRSLINRGYHQEAHNLLRRIYGKLEENIFHDIVASMEQQTTG